MVPVSQLSNGRFMSHGEKLLAYNIEVMAEATIKRSTGDGFLTADSVLISQDDRTYPHGVVVSVPGEWYKSERWSIEEFTGSRS